MVSVPNLARGAVDRDEPVRKDPDTRERVRRSKQARFLLVRGSELAAGQRGVVAVSWPQARLHGAEDAVYLGRVADVPYFACDVSGTGTLGDRGDLPGAVEPEIDGQPVHFEDVRVRAHEWPDDETALAVEAVAIIQWRKVTRFCHECGGALREAPSGWERRCEEGHSVFPRIDPAVIMAIRNDDDELLLGHNRAWAPGRYSVLAGFLEAGETLEAAVRREVFEEARVAVDRVEYVASQPWPFPRSLMLAFEGWTNGSQADVQVDGTEVEHARFFSRQDLKAAVAAGEVSLPNPTSIAWMLIERWLGEPLESAGWTSAELAHQPGRSPNSRG
ncbi:MAG: NAD(+) diphosphatase [Actinomycetaceae bacterium]|nr:NAD(+) diphosphatase [Actinomycetaceae bacterium]